MNSWYLPRSSDPNLVHHLAEVGGINTDVVRQVFVRHEMQNMGTPFHQVPEPVFG
jgi:hypothetical protein